MSANEMVADPTSRIGSSFFSVFFSASLIFFFHLLTFWEYGLLGACH